MSVLSAAFIVGLVCGLRALVGLAAINWVAAAQPEPLQGTWLAFLSYRATPYITSLLAIGELINDKMPKTPSRIVPPQFIARLLMGVLTGAVIGISAGQLVAGTISGIVGSLLGTFGGAKARLFAARLFGHDLPAALLEDAVAIVLVVLALR
jgi:uncharacterized membrane protein